MPASSGPASVELIDLWGRGCVGLLVSQNLHVCVCVCDMERLPFPLEKVPITSGLIRRHFALARRQSAKCRDTESTRFRRQELSFLSALLLLLVLCLYY